MRIVSRILLVTLVLSSLAAPSPADTAYLKNGNVLEGLVEKDGPDSVEFNLGFGSVILLKKEIVRLVKSDEKDSDKLWQKWGDEKKEAALRRPEEERLIKERQDREQKEEEEARRQRQDSDEFGPKEVIVPTQNGHFFVTVLLNGKTRAKLLLDSGASVIALPRRIADRLDIDVADLKKHSVRLADARVVEATQALIESVEVLGSHGGNHDDLRPMGIKVKNVQALFLTRDNDTIIETPDRIYTPDDGLLGMSFLKHFQINLNYKESKIIFQKIRET